jgi:hypothetical protein
VCEAIHVPPKLSFWKKHDRPVHGFVAWMAVLNMALIAWLPIAMYAQAPEQIDDATLPTVVSGVDSCVRQCEAQKSLCSMSAATSTQEERSAMCDTRAKDCYARCALAPHLGLPPKELKKDSKESRKTESASSSSERTAEKRAQQKKILTAKKRMSEFSRNLASIKRKIAQLEKNGMAVPLGLKDTILSGEKVASDLKAVDATVENDELDEIQGSMDSIAGTLKGSLGALEKQRKAPQKFAVLEKQMRQFDHQVATVKKISGKNDDLATHIMAVEESLASLKATYRQAHDLIIAGDADGGYALLDGQVPGLVKTYKEALKALYAARSQKVK